MWERKSTRLEIEKNQVEVIIKQKGDNCMEQIYLIKGEDLKGINEILKNGGRVKTIQTVSECVSAYGYAGSVTSFEDKGSYCGWVYAYVVVEFD